MDSFKTSVRVVQLIDSLNLGGAEVMSVNLSNLLDDNGIPVKLIATNSGGDALKRLKPGIPHEIIGKKGAKDLSAFLRLNKSIKNHKTTHLHAHSTSIIWASLIKVLHPPLKLIWHDHNGMREAIQAGFKNEKMQEFEKATSKEVVRTFIWTDRLTRFFSFLFYQVIVVNKTLKKHAIKNLKVKQQYIHYLDNFPYIQPIKDYKFEYSNKKNLIFVANIREQKSHDFFFSLVDDLLENHSDWQVLIVGKIFDDEWSKYIVKIHGRLKSKQRVLLLGARSDVHQLMLNSDLAVLTSKSEGLPVTLLEYGLSGLPTICTDVGACKEVIGNEAMITRFGDKESLIKKLSQFMANNELRIEESRRFKERIENQYSSKKVVSKINLIYNA